MFEIMLKLICLTSVLFVNNVLCDDKMYFEGDGQIIEASPEEVIERLDPDTKTFLQQTETSMTLYSIH